MKRSIKKYEKYFSIHHYISVLRKAPVHMQHMYAVIFAGSVTVLLAMAILYFDYGFWHERYNRSDASETEEVIQTKPQMPIESPGEMIGNFFGEVSNKIKTIGASSTDILDGKDSYIREE
jgi:hypothetical protein